MRYVLLASKLNYGLTINELKTMAYDFEKKERINPEVLKNWNGMASETNKHPTCERIQQGKCGIWNMDETGFPTVPAHVHKLLAEKGVRSVGQMTSTERGTKPSEQFVCTYKCIAFV